MIGRYIPKPQSYIGNSFMLVKKLSGKFIDDGLALILLDVVFLFINIPMELAMECLGKWRYIANKTNIPKT